MKGERLIGARAKPPTLEITLKFLLISKTSLASHLHMGLCSCDYAKGGVEIGFTPLPEPPGTDIN